MAQARFDQFSLTLEKQVVTLGCRVQMQGTSAPNLQAWNFSTSAYATATSSGFRGVLSVTRNGVGDYTFAFGAPNSNSQLSPYTFQRLLFDGFAATFDTTATAAAPLAPLWYIKAQNVTSNTSSTVRVVFLNGSLAATDPASGELLLARFTLSNSSAP